MQPYTSTVPEFLRKKENEVNNYVFNGHLVFLVASVMYRGSAHTLFAVVSRKKKKKIWGGEEMSYQWFFFKR